MDIALFKPYLDSLGIQMIIGLAIIAAGVLYATRPYIPQKKNKFVDASKTTK